MEQQKFFLSQQCFTVLGFAKTIKEKSVFQVFPEARKAHNIVCSDEHGGDLNRWIVQMNNPSSAFHWIHMKEYRALDTNLTIQVANYEEIPDGWVQEFTSPPARPPCEQANPMNPFPGTPLSNQYHMPPVSAQLPEGDLKPPLPPWIPSPSYESHMYDNTPSASPPADQGVSKKAPAPSKIKDKMTPEVRYTQEEDKEEDAKEKKKEEEAEEEKETESDEEPEDVNPRMMKVSGLPQNNAGRHRELLRELEEEWRGTCGGSHV